MAATTSTASAGLPVIRQVTISSLRPEYKPFLRIKTDEDVEAWQNTRGYQDYGLFLRRLAESVVNYDLPYSDSEPDKTVAAAIGMLDKLDRWIDDNPPLPTPQRFGNLAFRTWGRRLESESSQLLQELLPPDLHAAIPFVEPYFLTSFGSFTRMDYGTGHETSFALFLLCLTLLRFFAPEPRVERQMVLNLFVRYLRLCWRLQDVYKLEPAGSHGVWGLDDYVFLAYIFGSAQLRDQKQIPVDAVLRPPLPPKNLYFMSIMRIQEVKSGPFHEHSSQLHTIATGVPYWMKVHIGLFKMYEAEVLGKRVVVQHIPLGGLLEWNVPPPAEAASTPAPVASSATFSTTMPTIYALPPREPSGPTGFTSHALAPTSRSVFSSRGSIAKARMPLGPSASTAVRPFVRSGAVRGMEPPPPPASHSSSGGEKE